MDLNTQIYMTRGKVLGQEELEKIENYGRYRDVGGDGIPYRTLPGSGLNLLFLGELVEMKMESILKKLLFTDLIWTD